MFTAIFGLGLGRTATVADLEGDGLLEILMPGTYLGVVRPNGDIESTPMDYEYYGWGGIVVADLDGDGVCEIGARSRAPKAMHLFDANLEPEPLEGWPVAADPAQYTSGWNFTGIIDMDNDGDRVESAAQE